MKSDSNKKPRTKLNVRFSKPEETVNGSPNINERLKFVINVAAVIEKSPINGRIRKNLENRFDISVPMPTIVTLKNVTIIINTNHSKATFGIDRNSR